MPVKPVPICRGATGLSVRTDPARIAFDDKTGLRGLSRAVNTIVDPYNRIRIVPGFSLVSSGIFMVWGDAGPNGLAIKGSSLYILGEGGGLTAVQTLTQTPKLLTASRWMDKIFWTTGVEMGLIMAGQAFPWAPGTYVGPDTNKNFDGPLVGTILEAFAGRLLMAVGNRIYISELWDPTLFRSGTDFLTLSTDVTMIQAVSDGFWAGDNYFVYWFDGFQSGADYPNKTGWIPVRKGDFGCIPGQATKSASTCTPFDKLHGTGYVIKAGTDKGILTLGAGGFLNHDTEDTLEYNKSPWPMTALKGCAAEYNEVVYFCYEP